MVNTHGGDIFLFLRRNLNYDDSTSRTVVQLSKLLYVRRTCSDWKNVYQDQ